MTGLDSAGAESSDTYVAEHDIPSFTMVKKLPRHELLWLSNTKNRLCFSKRTFQKWEARQFILLIPKGWQSRSYLCILALLFSNIFLQYSHPSGKVSKRPLRSYCSMCNHKYGVASLIDWFDNWLNLQLETKLTNVSNWAPTCQLLSLQMSYGIAQLRYHNRALKLSKH